MAGELHTVVRLADGELWAFGCNYYVQLGIDEGTRGPMVTWVDRG